MGAWLWDILRRRLADDHGGSTVFAMTVLALTVMLAGLAIDAGNARRHKEILQMSSDAAAHAAIAALVRGEDARAVMDQGLAAVQWNTPETRHGAVFDDPEAAVTLMHFDPGTGALAEEGPANAVRVRLERSARTGNPVPTFLLRLVGVPSWDVATTSVAAIVPTRRCSNAEGLIAQGVVSIADPASFGAGVCLHSKTAIEPGRSLDFAKGARLSLPDLADCKGLCDDRAHQGIDAAKAEVNFIMPPFADHIRSLAAAFGDGGMDSAAETDFFATRPLDQDLSALEELLIDTAGLSTGDVIPLTPMTFSQMRAFPAGLTYAVTCDPSEPTLDIQAFGNPLILKDVAVVTDCPIWVDSMVSIEGALVLSTHEGHQPAIEVEAGAMAGDPAMTCNRNSHAVLAAMGEIKIPAEATASNVALLTAGDLAVRASSAAIQHRGTALLAGGELRLEGLHDFAACGQPMSPLLPGLEVIRQVMEQMQAPAPVVPGPSLRPEDMPGQAPERLESTPALIGSAERPRPTMPRL